MQNKRITINVDEEQHKQIKVYCSQLGITLKEFVLDLIKERMKRKTRMENEKDFEVTYSSPIHLKSIITAKSIEEVREILKQIDEGFHSKWIVEKIELIDKDNEG